MGVLDNAKKHFLDRLGTLRSMEVPEWGDAPGKPAVIFFKPATLKQQNEIYKHVREGSLEALVTTLIIRCLNENGEKIFKNLDRVEFMNAVDPDIIERVCKDMAKSDDSEEAAKN